MPPKRLVTHSDHVLALSSHLRTSHRLELWPRSLLANGRTGRIDTKEPVDLRTLLKALGDRGLVVCVCVDHGHENHPCGDCGGSSQGAGVPRKVSHGVAH